MKPGMVRDSDLRESEKRTVIGAPPGKENVVKPLEVIRGLAFDGEEYIPYQSIKLELDEEDIESLKTNGHFFINILGTMMPPISFGTREERFGDNVV